MLASSIRVKAATLAIAAIGVFGGMGPAFAQEFGKTEINQDSVVPVAAQGSGFIPYRLFIYEQVTDERQCWSESGTGPIAIDPLLLNFDFTGICRRASDTNGYSVRVNDEDLGSRFNLRIVETQDGNVLLRAVSNTEGSFTIGSTGGNSDTGFTRIILAPGWRLTKRTFEDRVQGHFYFTNDLTLAQVLADGDTPVVVNPTPPDEPDPTGEPTEPNIEAFPDIGNDVYATEIAQASELGFISGFQDGTFRPQTSLTREQAVSMVLDALALKLPVTDLQVPTDVSQAPFPDVAANRWSASKIQFAKVAGIVSGDQTGTFRPADTVSRVELMAILRRAAEYERNALGLTTTLPSTQDPVSFSDIQGHWGQTLIAQMSSFCGVASPINESGSAFVPDSPTLRNYAAAATLRMINCGEPQSP
ncbi:MAG: DUF3747 domain-containing protein [Cyanobacteria bacterium P01_A01_bin.123]